MEKEAQEIVTLKAYISRGSKLGKVIPIDLFEVFQEILNGRSENVELASQDKWRAFRLGYELAVGQRKIELERQQQKKKKPKGLQALINGIPKFNRNEKGMDIDI